ncbi:hypothetical protein [Brevundimonas sp. A19_0]|uniref:hypothetical protein n=1 Tax=Brevundimonas sp. A19_0 TaxID=2821087 RepID=UPI001AD9C233|nr:hypothetical protein [Brevundimonas sp. A19_0]MBO9500168.1 hypothetical protein [Brevundimonas sp. A19_0]
MQRYLIGLAIALVLALAPLLIGHAGLDWLIGALAPAWPIKGSHFAQACRGDPATGLAAHHLILTLLWSGGLIVLANALRTSQNRIDRALDPMAWRMRYIVPAVYVFFGLYCFGPLVTTFGDPFGCGAGRSGFVTVLMTLGVMTTFIASRFVIFATSGKRA